MARRRGVFRRRAACRATHRGKRCGCLSVFMVLLLLAAAGVAQRRSHRSETVSRHLHRRMERHDRRELDGRTEERLGEHLHLFVGEFGARHLSHGVSRRVVADQHVQDRRRSRRAACCSSGSDEKERPINLTFDWQKKRVTGVAKERAVDLELPEGAQDAMSLQIASLRNLASGKLKGTVWMIDATKLKEYELHLEGNAPHRDRARRARHRDLHQQARTTPRASRAPGWRPPWAIYPSRPSASTARKY